MYLRYILLASILTFIATSAEEDALLDRLCDGQTRRTCECVNESEQQSGLQTLRIDCSFKDLKTSDFPGDVLPLYTSFMDISWNKLAFVPFFESDSLKILNAMHNNVSELYEKNFIRLTMLRELYLNWNAIQTISSNAFAGLRYLQVLDLSHNNLKHIGFNVFTFLSTLDTLNISWNRQLNNTPRIQEVDFYSQFGVHPKLSTLKLDTCGLMEIHLPEKAPLNTLSLRDNQFENIPSSLPVALKELDISGNPLPSLLEIHTLRLTELEVLFVEDMPALRSVEYNSLAHLSKLKALSFQNCRRLTSFHEFAFGTNTSNCSLDVLSFRGSTLRTFNQTLLPVFKQLMELDLNGMPLRCDCEMIWVKELKIETNGRCISPSSLRGMKLSNVRMKDFSCDRWPRWVYGLLILLLLILCAAGICLIVMGLRPHRGVAMRRTVGSTSPYARVTIEPNRQESRYY